jgi:hypothetical protein
VGHTAVKTAKVIQKAEGGVLFVDEAYQLTDAQQRGQTDFGGEAVDEMMRKMLDKGPGNRRLAAPAFRAAGLMGATCQAR